MKLVCALQRATGELRTVLATGAEKRKLLSQLMSEQEERTRQQIKMDLKLHHMRAF